MTIDLISRQVSNYGWLPIIKAEEKEIFRGSFQSSAEAALGECQKYLPQALEEHKANG